MPLRYPIILILIFMILALSRGFVVQNFGELVSFNALHALAQSAGDGGGDAGDGAGDGGGDAGDGAGDGGGDAGGGAGDGGGDAGDGGAGDADGGFGGPSAPAPVLGCMDPSANNYNPSATSQTGITCTYTVYGCMDPSATNYNPFANSQTGITCTYPPTPVCILTINPDTIVAGGSAALAWGFSSDVTSLLINNGIGVKTSRSYQYVTPNTSTTYSGVATSPYGSAVCSASVTVTAAPPAPIIGCMDPSATNYNPAATSQTGVTCTYPPPPAPIIGCMDPSATNYNPAATSQTGVTCTYPPPAAPLCTLTASPASVQTGSSSTLSWTTTNATSFSINQSIGAVTPVASGSRAVTPPSTRTYTGTATGTGGTVTCAATVTVTATPPPPPAPLCTLTASPASVQTGSSSTLSWTTTNATSFSINQSIGAVTPVASGTRSVSPSTTTTYTGTATGTGGTVTCAATVTVTTPSGGSEPSGGGAYGGSGGGAYAPNVTLAALPRANAQPLAYLYLSQIPYTGLELGPVGMMVYWVALIAWALALSYLVLFGALPVANRSLRQFGSQVVSVLNARELAPVSRAPSSIREPHIIVSETEHEEEIPEAPQGHSSYDGFKSFAHNGALSIEDIVKSLSRKHPTLDTERNVEPIEKTEPVYENVESVVDRRELVPTPVEDVPASTRGLVSALVEGDRAAVFAGLRQQVRGGGAPEKLITDIVCLLDDAYRARIDGTASDAAVTRLSARLSTPTLEKLIAALTTAIDSSYSEGTTGAKLALTRALAVLGA